MEQSDAITENQKNAVKKLKQCKEGWMLITEKGHNFSLDAYPSLALLKSVKEKIDEWIEEFTNNLSTNQKGE
jgi:hypothetical protein